MIFWDRKSQNQIFFIFFIKKVSNFISNLNDDFHEASFEVYYISVHQKLVILGFSPQFFSF
jgi:hypothetical protein